MQERTLVVTYSHQWNPVGGWLQAANVPHGQVAGPAATEAIAGASPPFAAVVLVTAGDPGHSAQARALCRWIRGDARFRHLPLVWVVREGLPVDLYEAFNSGASDYVVNPEDPVEFLLRLRALIRRAARHAPLRRIETGDLVLDLDAHAVHAGGRHSSLTPREAAILTYLAGRRGQPSTTEELLTGALGYPPRQGNPEVVRTHVRHLREKLEVDPSSPRILVNVPRVGYKLVLDGAAAKPGGNS